MWLWLSWQWKSYSGTSSLVPFAQLPLLPQPVTKCVYHTENTFSFLGNSHWEAHMSRLSLACDLLTICSVERWGLPPLLPVSPPPMMAECLQGE